jgi:hypothetical protein
MAQSVSIETTHPTYAYRAADITPAATPTDVLAQVCICILSGLKNSEHK